MEAESTELLPCVQVEPFEGQPRHCVLWLHGLGADGHDFEPVVPELQLDPAVPVRFVFPHAPSIPVTINGGMVMPAWYDIEHMDLERRQDEEGLQRSVQHVAALIRRENERGVPTDNVILAGFSQGGAVALHAALRHPEPLAGLLLLSTYMLFPDRAAKERTQANEKIPIFQAHGTFDPMVPIAGGQAARRALEELAHDVEWHEYPMQHQVCMEELRDIGAWMRPRLASRG